MQLLTVVALVVVDVVSLPEGYETMETSAYLDHRIALGVAEG